jgi:hypothetical protein
MGGGHRGREKPLTETATATGEGWWTDVVAGMLTDRETATAGREMGQKSSRYHAIILSRPFPRAAAPPPHAHTPLPV